MKINRNLSQIALVAGTLLFSIGLQTYAQTWTPPASSPPNSNAYAPLTTGPSVEIKRGGLLINTGNALNGLIVQNGNVGIGTVSPSQKLDVAGYVKGQTGICIGSDCRTSWPANPGRGQPVYMCPSEGAGCGTTCTGALSTNSTCQLRTTNNFNDCYVREVISCSLVGYLNP